MSLDALQCVANETLDTWHSRITILANYIIWNEVHQWKSNERENDGKFCNFSHLNPNLRLLTWWNSIDEISIEYFIFLNQAFFCFWTYSYVGINCKLFLKHINYFSDIKNWANIFHLNKICTVFIVTNRPEWKKSKYIQSQYPRTSSLIADFLWHDRWIYWNASRQKVLIHTIISKIKHKRYISTSYNFPTVAVNEY